MLETSDRLQAEVKKLITAVNNLIPILRQASISPPASRDNHRDDAAYPCTSSSSTSQDWLQATKDDRNTALKAIWNIQALLSDSSHFIQYLAIAVQLLACLHWLNEGQVLACIPLSGCVAVTDVAQLSGVDDVNLLRIVRMMATAGFLHEPEPGHVSHTSLSAQYVSNVSHRDAIQFLAEDVRCPTDHKNDCDTLASRAFTSKPKMQRRWSAFVSHTSSNCHRSAKLEVLSRLDWKNLGNACVVEANATSAELSNVLADRHPELRFVVQIDSPMASSTSASRGHQRQQSHPGAGIFTNYDVSSDLLSSNQRVTIQPRSRASPQPVRDAAVYILALPDTSARSLWDRVQSSIWQEWKVHFQLLKSNPTSALIIMTGSCLPRPGSVDLIVEALARQQDLALVPLGAENEAELLDLLDAVAKEGLTVVNQLQSRDNSTVAICVKSIAK